MYPPPPHPIPLASGQLLNGRFTLIPSRPPADGRTDKLPPLYNLYTGCRLAELYQLCFPHEPAWRALRPNWQDEKAVMAAIEAFFLKVSANLFPVHEELLFFGELREVQWHLYNIPIMVFGFDVWYDDLEGLKEPLPFLNYLCNLRHNEYYDEESRYDALDLPDDLEPTLLVKQLKRMTLPEPLAGVPHIIQMLELSTGNIFLDAGENGLADSYSHPSWEKDNIDWLIKEWQEAKPIVDKVYRIFSWKEADSNIITAVCDLLLQAHAQLQQEKENEPATP